MSSMDIGPGDVVICVDARTVVTQVPLVVGRRYTVQEFDDDYDCRFCGRCPCTYVVLAEHPNCECGCGLKASFCPTRFTKRPPERDALFRSMLEPTDIPDTVVLEPNHA